MKRKMSVSIFLLFALITAGIIVASQKPERTGDLPKKVPPTVKIDRRTIVQAGKGVSMNTEIADELRAHNPSDWLENSSLPDGFEVQRWKCDVTEVKNENGKTTVKVQVFPDGLKDGVSLAGVSAAFEEEYELKGGKLVLAKRNKLENFSYVR